MSVGLFVSLHNDSHPAMAEATFKAWLSRQEGVTIISAESPFSATVSVDEEKMDRFIDAASQLCSIRKLRTVKLL